MALWVTITVPMMTLRALLSPKKMLFMDMIRKKKNR